MYINELNVSLDFIKLKFSIENAEKVVRPPHIPTTRK
jgi:hypothetical protein|tara:strand:- start:480 stop:590 length:111 start_codon:yes stop_codon:yes gene_type:complete